jgi:hypothetical protein
MESGEEKKGFTIRDRRASTQPAETDKEEPKKTEAPSAGAAGKEKSEGQERKQDEKIQLPEINFSSFILSLSTSALMHLGEVPDPVTEKVDKNLPLAKQSIDMLGMLRDKTRGNLTPDEEKLMDHLLTDLRWRYVREAKS